MPDMAQNGYIWVWPMGVNVALHGDEKDISRYYFSRNVMGKTFCRTCGMNMTNQPAPLTSEEVAAMSEDDRKWFESSKLRHPVNVRVLDGVDLTKLKIIKMTRGLDLPPKYVNP